MVDLGFLVSTITRSFPVSTFWAVANKLKFRSGGLYFDRMAKNGCSLDGLDR